MINDKELMSYTEIQLKNHFGAHVKIQALIVIGSFAYPEFARNNSDIDLIALRVGGDTDNDSLHIEVADFEGVRRLIELRIFTVSSFYQYVMHCDIAQSYAFVRGYRFILSTPDAERTVKLAISRYFSDASRMWAEMRAIGLHNHLMNIQFLMTDCRNQLLSPRVQDDPLLKILRTAEVTKDFIGQVWMALLMEKYENTDEGKKSHITPESKLLQDLGLLRVFLGLRGGRMVDGGKYSKSAEVDRLIQEVRICSGLGTHALIDGLELIFTIRFGHHLFLL